MPPSTVRGLGGRGVLHPLRSWGSCRLWLLRAGRSAAEKPSHCAVGLLSRISHSGLSQSTGHTQQALLLEQRVTKKPSWAHPIICVTDLSHRWERRGRGPAVGSQDQPCRDNVARAGHVRPDSRSLRLLCSDAGTAWTSKPRRSGWGHSASHAQA